MLPCLDSSIFQLGILIAAGEQSNQADLVAPDFENHSMDVPAMQSENWDPPRLVQKICVQHKLRWSLRWGSFLSCTTAAGRSKHQTEFGSAPFWKFVLTEVSFCFEP